MNKTWYLRPKKSENNSQTSQTSNVPVKTNYSSLVNKINSGTLLKGSLYEISDFKTLHLIPNTTERNDTNKTIDIEPLVVMAISSTELALEASSLTYPNDIIHYTPDNTWWGALEHADSKGAITYRKDTDKNITMPQDFRACVFRRWAADLATDYNSHDGIYCLWDTSVTIGTAGAPSVYSWSNGLTLTATDVNDFTDHFTFGDYANSHSVDIGRANGDVIANIVSLGYIYSVSALNASNIHVQNLKEFVGMNKLAHLLNVPASVQTIDQAIAFHGYGGSSGVITNNFLVGEVLIETHSGMFDGNTIIPLGLMRQLVLVQPKNVRSLYLSYIGSVFDTCYAKFQDIRLITVKELDGDKSSWDARDYNVMVGMRAPAWWEPYQIVYDFTGSPLPIVFNADQRMSNIEVTLAASTALDFGEHTPQNYAGIVNLTGSGTVALATLLNKSSHHAINMLLKPVSGLTIDIAFNDVDWGFVNSATVSAVGASGDVILLERLPNERWKASKL